MRVSTYVFAIDRLARKVSIVLSVKDYLLKNNINLVFLNPHKMSTMRINDNGEKVEDELTGMMLMPTLCDPMDCSLPGSSVHGIFQARILVWVDILYH